MIYENVNRNKLHQEFVDVGIIPISVFAINETGYGAKIKFDDNVDMELVQQIIDAHDLTPLAPQPNKIEIQQEIINTLGQELAQLKLHFMIGGM